MQYAFSISCNILPNRPFPLRHIRPLKQRHHSSHNGQQPNPGLHTPRSTLARRRGRTCTPCSRSAPRARPARCRTPSTRRHRAASAGSLRPARAHARLQRRTPRRRRRMSNRRGSGRNGGLHRIGRDDGELVRVVRDGGVSIIDDFKCVACARY
jgi:hypothetical protein